MTFWYVLLIVVFLICFLIRNSNTDKKVYYGVIVILCIVAGIRTNIGDTDTYIKYINEIPDSYYALSQIIDFDGEWGFKVVVFVLKKIFFNNSQLVLAFFSTVSVILILNTIRKLTKIYDLGTYIFICSAIFITIMNGVRQYFVAAIIFSLIDLIYEKKWKSFFVVVILLSTIHRSVLILLPIYFILNNKPWSKTTYITLLIGVVLYLTFPMYNRMLSDYLISSGKYTGYASQLLDNSYGGNLIRVFVAAVPLILAKNNNQKLLENEKYYNIIFNLSTVNVVFYLLAVNNYIFARFCFYFSLASIVLLCWGIQYIGDRRTKIFSYVLCIVFYYIYYYYQVSVIWNTPYTTIFN